MASEFELGLHNIAGNPNLTFITFMAVVLLIVLGFRFFWYAVKNARATGLPIQRSLWIALSISGGLALVYGFLGTVEIISSLNTPYRSAVMLGVALSLAIGIRETHTATGDGSPASTGEQLLRVGFGAIVVGLAGGLLVWGPTTTLAGLEGVTAVLFLAYGAAPYHARTAPGRLRGTLLDSLVRHLVPVLTFAALVSIVSSARLLGVDRVIVLHVQVVFVIMTATALMTATIKLQQNLAGL